MLSKFLLAGAGRQVQQKHKLVAFWLQAKEKDWRKQQGTQRNVYYSIM